MKCTRWIALCVDTNEHPVVGMQVPPPPALDKNRHAQAPFAAWIDLISSANWKDTQYSNKGVVITLARGEFIAGRAYWSKRWNWTENAVRGFFARLVENGMIEFSHQSKGHSANVASICNYETYQTPKLAARQSNHQSSTSHPPDSYQLVSNNTREEPKTDDGLKAAFNGSTDRMVADAMRWMNCPEVNARKWLATTLSASGREATIGAYQSLIEKQATNQPIANPMIYWARAAAGWKPPKQSAAKRYQTDEPRLVIDKQTPLHVRPA